jgi:hypothetical protein
VPLQATKRHAFTLVELQVIHYQIAPGPTLQRRELLSKDYKQGV